LTVCPFHAFVASVTASSLIDARTRTRVCRQMRSGQLSFDLPALGMAVAGV
jgi:hypothetical protein